MNFYIFEFQMAYLFRSVVLQSLSKTTRPMWTSIQRNMSSHNKETDEEFDRRWKAYFDRQDIDGIDKIIIKYSSLFLLFQVGTFDKVSIT